MEYAKFLVLNNQKGAARDKLATLLEEFEFMRGGERKVNSATIREVRELYSKINSN
jgi:hypothetical protein